MRGSNATLYVNGQPRPILVTEWAIFGEPTIIPAIIIDWPASCSFTIPFRWLQRRRSRPAQSAYHIAHAAYGLTRKGSQGWRQR